ncbi:RidA family protein [Oceanidesulfovibrio marinus]|uniref:RidA family protein n=1 Tax=Oceanidesulfovibrio marinus TaxID=370038 RepID=A0A6P1ZQG9_9BACT|nr:RidA family protein [Oceanidesulfovibrio marinus]TVM36828.1 RidA family protein [Oceanidesulfovibrio marinus]
MSNEAISTEKAPKAVGPYSQAVKTGNLLFVSGQLPIDPATGSMVEGTIQDKTRRSLTNLAAVAEAGGTSLKNAVKVTVFLADIADFAAANEVYKEFFESPFPARSAVQVAALPLGGQIEIEAIFSIPA